MTLSKVLRTIKLFTTSREYTTLVDRLTVALLSLVALSLYISTAAQGTIFGDPSEYQFIPAIWGIAHPPGYAVYTIIAGVWQRLIQFGSMAWRAHLLACANGAWVVSRAATIIFMLVRKRESERSHQRFVKPGSARAAVFIVCSLLMLAPDIWQHSIHSNAHIMSVAISATQLWICVKWYVSEDDNWLYALAFFCGIGVTHHPITVWSLPAYALFILVVRPAFWREGRKLIVFVISGLCGLLPWLYFPLRSPSAPFGPTDMATWEGFLRHATAQGLRVNLFHFGLADQWNRLRVFYSLLRLQYPIVFIIVAITGVIILWRNHRAYAVLITAFLLGHLLFTLNSVQDVMAYLLHPFMALAVPMGYGLWLMFDKWNRSYARLPVPALAALVLLTAIWTPALLTTYTDISLRNWRDADDYLAFLRARFDNQGEDAAIVSDWEHLTPYYYQSYVEGAYADSQDYHPVVVSGATPWVESVFAHLPAGPVYLTNYRPDVRDLGFRLRPDGPLWQVLEPPASSPVNPDVVLEDVWVDDKLQLLGYDLVSDRPVQPGDIVALTLYAAVKAPITEIYLPAVSVGGTEQAWMTDSRLLTPDWLPGEIIAEQYEIFVPYAMQAGDYPVVLDYEEATLHKHVALSSSDGVNDSLILGVLRVEDTAGRTHVKTLNTALTNIGNDVVLASASMRSGLQRQNGFWTRPFTLARNRTLNLTLTWQVLARPRKNYTVFLHLLDQNGQLAYGYDYTPLGGAFPSYLWFPKWLPGQVVTDPYRLVIPDTVPPGLYSFELGMYEMGSVRRIPQLDSNGNMAGDRLILGSVIIQ